MRTSYYVNKYLKEGSNMKVNESVNYLNEKKATSFDIKKLKYFSKDTIISLLNTKDFHNKRVVLDGNIVGGTQKDTKLFIKTLIQNDKKSTKELNFKYTKDQLFDYEYLRKI